MRPGQITALTLGGFQVFKETNRFPLGPLTLLYGPNSAGKSAICDALHALAEFCGCFLQELSDQPRRSPDPRLEAGRLLERHWRVERGSPLVLAKELCLGAELLVDRFDWATQGFAVREPRWSHETLPNEERIKAILDEAIREAFRPWLTEGDTDKLELTLRFQLISHLGQDLSQDYAKGRGNRFELPFSATVALGGVPLLQTEGWFGVALNLRHPAISGLQQMSAFDHLVRSFPSYCSMQGGWLRFAHVPAPGADGLNYSDLTVLLTSDDNDDRGRFDEICEEACRAFVDLFDSIWLSTFRKLHSGLSADLVQASRTIPSKRDLTYLLDEEGAPLQGDRLGLTIEPRPEFRSLASAALHAALGGDVPFHSEHYQRALERMNGLLADHLFIERGYYLTAAVHLLQPLVYESPLNERDIADNDAASSTPREIASYLVSLVLSDVHGRNLAFDEVGSGLGYALPVLWAIASKRLTFIQQPELHLHPALQAALADAFIVGLNSEQMVEVEKLTINFVKRPISRQHIIETHSEHLLLRLLRRIRQGNQVDRAGDPLSLKRDDLVVLYVAPAPDGTSSVKHLRVDRSGDFLDRWPRGFFEERWKELSGD